MFDEPDPPAAAAVASLVAALAAGGLPGLPPAAAPLAATHPAALREGLAKSVGGLEDLALDVPKAPALLGGLLGAALGAGLGPDAPAEPALSLSDLTALVEPIESAEPRRALVAAALSAAAAALGGTDKLASAAAAAGWTAGPTLVFDAEFDGEMEGAAEFLTGAGLGGVPV
jgi:translation initiation factor 4G